METFEQGFQKVNAPTPNVIKEFPFDERLSAWELSQLWSIYQANSSMQCILQYFVSQAQDPEIKTMLNDALNAIPPQLSTMIKIFNSVGFPIPHGFSDEDVEPNAKRLYSDSLMLTYLRLFNKFGLVKLAHALPLAMRPDVREYLNSALVTAQNLLNKTEDLIAKKGMAVKPPYTPIPDRVIYVTDQSYYGGLFGKQRPMNILELTHVFERLESKISEGAILLGFCQIAKDEKVKAYASKGVNVYDKRIARLTSVLKDEDLPVPLQWRSEVTDSTESPFSDRLILFHIMSSIAFSVTASGFALGNCTRTDLLALFAKAILDLQSFGKDGFDLMIEKGWMEEIPLTADRNKIIGLSH